MRTRISAGAHVGLGLGCVSLSACSLLFPLDPLFGPLPEGGAAGVAGAAGVEAGAGGERESAAGGSAGSGASRDNGDAGQVMQESSGGEGGRLDASTGADAAGGKDAGVSSGGRGEAGGGREGVDGGGGPLAGATAEPGAMTGAAPGRAGNGNVAVLGAGGDAGAAAGGTAFGMGGVASGEGGAGGSEPCAYSVCSGACVDTQTDKQHCGKCDLACEGYQFCDGGQCLPTYLWTQILASSFTSGGAPTLRTAAVDNKVGDLLLQVDTAAAPVTFSTPGSPMTLQYSDLGVVARYTASGTLVWARSEQQLSYKESDTWTYELGTLSDFALASNGDLVIGYRKRPPSSPGTPSPLFRLGRFSAANATRIWEVVFSSANSIRSILPRPTRNDFITFSGQNAAMSLVVDGGTMESSIGPLYGAAAAVGQDDGTLWIWGGGIDYAGALALNPWSTSTWDMSLNPGRYNGSDGFILGAQETGQTIGPWFTEGDWGTTFRVVLDSAGDLVGLAQALGLTRFNGGQPLLDASGQVLFKVRHTDGAIIWRTVLPAYPKALAVVPGGRLATLIENESTYQLDIYSGTDGTLLTSIETGLPASLIAVGTSDVFILGMAGSAVDFDPGPATDPKGSPEGIFVSRYTF